MRRERHAVDTEHRARNLVHDRGYGFDVRYPAQYVGGVGASHQAGFVRHQGLEVGGQELGVRGGGRLPPFKIEGFLGGELDPGGDVGFVVEGGDDDLGAGREDEGGGEVAEELGCGGAEDCLGEKWGMIRG